MLDVHCHLLPGVDDGAKDWPAALAMARALVAVGFHKVAPSPHFGEGPGGDVARARAAEVRAELQERLREAGIALELLPNAEHHVTPALFERILNKDVTPVGGEGEWLLVELPWRAVPNPDEILFRLQTRGYKLLLAHPERYHYLEHDNIARLVERGVKLQLELGSFVNVYGDRSEKRARALMKAGLAHVVATDLHRAEDGEGWLPKALAAFTKSYGKQALTQGANDNPERLLRNAAAHELVPMEIA